MKKSTKMMILVAMAVQILAVAAYVNNVGAASVNYVSLHKDSGSKTDAVCKGCHGNKGAEASSERAYMTAHKRHLRSSMLKFQCKTCHQSTVTSENWNAKIQNGEQQHNYEGNLSHATTDSYETTIRKARKNVPPELCKTCHGKFPSAGTHLASGVTTSSRCQTCHVRGSGDDETDPNLVHVYNTGAYESVLLKKKGVNYGDGSTYLGGINHNAARNTRKCVKCHGGLQWFQDTHEKADNSKIFN